MLHSIDAEGKLEAVSELWLKKLGYARAEVLGRPSIEFLTEPSRRYAREVVLPEFFRTGSCDVEYEFRRKDGTVLPVRLRGTAVYDGGGKFVRSNAVLEDLSEQRALERKMFEAQKLESLGLMAGNIAHDFNNMLGSILGNAQLAADAVKGNAPAESSIEQITTAARRASDLCRQLLAYSGRGQLTIARTDLSELVREMARVLEVTLSRDVAIELELAQPGPRVEVDATQVRQVVMNLVMNAAEASIGGRGRITVVTGEQQLEAREIARMALPDAAPGRFAFVLVRDAGMGMSPETVGRMFDPFFTTKPGGRGLGLAAVHGILRGHGGTLRVTSELGRGTTFAVFFPLVKVQAETQA